MGVGFMGEVRRVVVQSNQLNAPLFVLCLPQVKGAALVARVKNLQVQGCVFDRDKLSDTQRDSGELLPVATCAVAWVPAKQRTTSAKAGELSTPLYVAPFVLWSLVHLVHCVLLRREC